MQATLSLYRELLAPWGLTYQQAMVLAVVWELEPLSPGELAGELSLDSSSVTGLLNRMERRGLLSRSADITDRRRITIRSTDRSHEIRSQLIWVEDCIASAIALNHEGSTELVSRLWHLRTNLESYTPPIVNTLNHHGEGTQWNSETSA